MDFRKHLKLSGGESDLKGLISINDTCITCRFYITRIREYYLVVAY
ncbi:MAG: hypothetical protein LRY55_08810 [Leadbetterella sp.]|nr:hypothetical protein [Leadbetterella sp.]